MVSTSGVGLVLPRGPGLVALPEPLQAADTGGDGEPPRRSELACRAPGTRQSLLKTAIWRCFDQVSPGLEGGREASRGAVRPWR
jgi:hypothetical protein